MALTRETLDRAPYGSDHRSGAGPLPRRAGGGRCCASFGEAPRSSVTATLTSPVRLLVHQAGSMSLLIARGRLTAAPFAALEAIASLGSGFETMPISQRVAGRYRFPVHHPVDGLSTTSSRVSLSNAQVRVYVGSSATPVFFNVPPARPGTLWTVFEMVGQPESLRRSTA